MDEFFVEKNANDAGDHMVHTACCPSLPGKDQMRYLGVRSNTQAPLKEASDWYAKVTLCPQCISA